MLTRAKTVSTKILQRSTTFTKTVVRNRRVTFVNCTSPQLSSVRKATLNIAGVTMKRITSVAVFCLSFVSITCKQNTPTNSGTYNVSGNLVQNGKPVPSATVSLSKKIEYTTQSDTNGNFSISNVANGEYNLTVDKANADGSFLSRNSNISVSGDVHIESLILPKAIFLRAPIGITSSTMTIAWNSTDANDFREYKLYRNLSSGLDENTGTLAHVSTAINDTQFVDGALNPLTTYYYRVYVMNEFGRVGGSNIVNSKTLDSNLIVNGSFEDINRAINFPNQWKVLYSSSSANKFSVDTLNFIDGNKSINCRLEVGDKGNNWFLYAVLDPSKFEVGKRYEFSFWYKADTLEQWNNARCYFGTDFNNLGNTSLFILNDFFNATQSPSSPINWTKYTYDFTVPSGTPSNYYLMFAIDRIAPSNYQFNLSANLWLDNLKIGKIQ